MKKLIFALFAVLAVCVSSCSKYDDSDLWNSVNDLDKRVKALEELCKQMNINITSIQTIINASKDGDYITSITPLTEGGKEIGYTITFSNSPSITIYHGKDGQNGANGSDGKDGITPNISVKMDTDGYYYWTLNGEWILDDSGKKILAQGINGNDGQSGRDGITPQLKIEDGGWYISYDNGQSWNFLGRATGEAGDSMFSSIDTSNPDYVIFTLADGSEIKLARHDELSISFDSEDLIAMQPNSTRSIKYTIAGATGNLKVEVLSSGNVRAKISDNTSATGILTITTGATIDEYDKVIMLASDGKTTVMKSLSFEEAGLRVKSDLNYEIEAGGGTIQINIETNTEYSVSIPREAQSWISQFTPSRAWRNEIINLKVEANNSFARSTTIALLDVNGHAYVSIAINQKPSDSYVEIPEETVLAFPDEAFRAYVLDNFDLDKDGKISSVEALNVTEISYNFVYGTSLPEIHSLKGIEYFRNLLTLKFRGEINDLDLSQNARLETLYMSELFGLESLDLSKNIALREIIFNHNRKIKSLDFSSNVNLSSLIISDLRIKDINLSNCTKLKQLSFWGCYNLSALDVSNNLELKELACEETALESLDLSKNSKLGYLLCKNNPIIYLDITKTNIDYLYKASDGSFTPSLNCYSETLRVLYVAKDQHIQYITQDRNNEYIHPATVITYVE